jgi:hypothetical protein
MRVRAIAGTTLFATLAGCEGTERALAPTVLTPDRAHPSLVWPCDINWVNPVSGNWYDGAMWDLGRSPFNTEVACIETPGSYTVTVAWGGARTIYLGDGVSNIGLAIQGSSPTSVDPDLEAGTLVVRHNATAAMTAGAWVDLGALEVEGSFQIQGYNEIDRIEVRHDALLITAGPTTIGGVRDFEIEGNVFVSAGTYLALQLDQWAGTAARFDSGATVLGDGGLYVNAYAGSSPSVRWYGGTLGTRVSDATQPVVVARGAGLFLAPFGEKYGAIDLDPAGDSIDVSGTIDPNVRVRVKRAQWAGIAPVHFDDLTNDGQLEITTALSDGTRLSGGLVNRGMVTGGAGLVDFRLDSLRNEGTLVVTDSLRMTRGRLINAGTVRLTGGAADVVVAGSADFVAEPTGSITGKVSLEGNGRAVGNGMFDRLDALGGTVNPGGNGSSLGSLTMNTLTLSAGSRVVVDVLDGGASGLSSDRLHIVNNFAMAGALEAREAGGTPGRCGDVIRPITSARTASRTGAFTQLLGMNLSNDRRWRVHTPSTSVELIGHDPSRVLSISNASLAGTEGMPGQPTELCLSGNGPSANVTVDATSRFAQSSMTPNPVVFTTANWMYPRLLTVAAIDDAIAEPVHHDSIRFRLVSTDVAYQGIAQAQVAHSITDNDVGTDLTVAVVTSPPAVNLNQQFEARFRITNSGPAASSGSTFTITPMSGMTYVSNTPHVTCAPSTGVLTCTAGALAASSSVEFVIAFRATTTGAQVSTLRIAGVEYDPVTTNDTVVWNITVN